MNILQIDYNSTNYYLIDSSQGKVLIDAGWPGTLGKFRHLLNAKGIRIDDIKHVLITHYHPDHAGLAGALMESGARLIIIEQQVPFVPLLKNYVKHQEGYTEIPLEDALRIKIGESLAFLKSLGLNGIILHTPGHSEDSITLVLENRIAFTGDLPYGESFEENNPLIKESWAKIKECGVGKIYPGHGQPFDI